MIPSIPRIHSLASVMGVLVVVDRELDEEQVHRAFVQHVRSQPESAGGGTSRSNAGVGEGEFRLRKPALSEVAHQGTEPFISVIDPPMKATCPVFFFSNWRRALVKPRARGRSILLLVAGIVLVVDLVQITADLFGPETPGATAAPWR